ncbi:MAG: DNA polymerase III subunit delta, partial [Clostridia bacterium]|nr:DNA polymerase III subunit delta [Clostridia bacterium]
MKFIELSKNLKQVVKPLYNIKGEDFFLVNQSVILLKQAFIKDLEEFNYAYFDEETTLGAFSASLETLPIGNDYRLVVINKPNQEILNYISTYDFANSSTVLAVLNADKFTLGEAVDCSFLDKANLNKYVLNFLSKQNLSIEERALDYLIEVTEGSMARIVTELNKLVAYALDEPTITIDMVTNLVADTSQYMIYTLTNAIDERDYVKYQTVLSDISKTQSFAEIFAYMGKHFRRMQYIALNKDDEKLAKILNIKPYAIKMSRQF